jgi:ribonucleoside-diphosphate reductase alpha chain
MKSAAQVSQSTAATIGFQEASLDIWDKKYRLKAKSGEVIDETMDDTYKRVAGALAEVEAEADRERWYEQFLWALRHGAVPAGRIISNAGARHHKPATSTINCTVSGSIGDSMHDILDKVHEAGLTLKAGCGIGYEFSTLRPKGAYVSGAGAYTSGPLSFMDIYDKMCFTVSSAGGRRGAQMGTFDVSHPDVADFIRAKREDGRLRQFNLSLLVTDDFIQAVRAGNDWPLVFPIDTRQLEQGGVDLDDSEQVVWRDWPVMKGYVTNEAGQTACMVYKKIPARRLWDLIMSSTYDFAEPGFVLVDRVNEMNNNWFAENIRATNPCVTADTWVQTSVGPQQVRDLLGRQFEARVDGECWSSGAEGFFATGSKAVVRLETAAGYALRLTANHRVRRVQRFDGTQIETEWCEAGQLVPGDRVLLHDHRSGCEWPGNIAAGADEGYLLGLVQAGAGQVSEQGATLFMQREPAAANAPIAPLSETSQAIMAAAQRAAGRLASDVRWTERADYGEHRLDVPALAAVTSQLGLTGSRPGSVTERLEKTSSDFYRGYLRGCFDLRGELTEEGDAGPALRYTAGPDEDVAALQRMLLRLGIVSRRSGQRSSAMTGTCLWISGGSLARFAELIGFSAADKSAMVQTAIDHPSVRQASERFVARVKSVAADGQDTVYDCQVPGINTFDANGLHAHNCGEQPLPPYGSCLLGSVNLTKFVNDAIQRTCQF